MTSPYASEREPGGPFDVLIIGGGFSGAVLAIQLLRQSSRLSVAILDSNSLPGRGLAYSSPHRFHLINVPAGEMSALPDAPDDFLQWARSHFDAGLKDRSFPPRLVYGSYIGDLFHRTLATHGQRCQWLQGTAISVHPLALAFSIQMGNGSEILARSIVLATGNPPPADPVERFNLSRPGYFPHAWAADAIEDLDASGSVLLLGSGLTSLDLIMALKSRRFRGPIHVLSRTGLFPQARRQWRPFEPWPVFWSKSSPATVRELLRLVRSQVRLAAEKGIDWRAVIDSLRPVAQPIWRSLSLKERTRFLRHVRPYWDVHRHRVAPEIADLLADMRADGQVLLHKGILSGLKTRSSGVEVTFCDLHTHSEKVLPVSRVINCNDSDPDFRRLDDPLMNSLFRQGLARPDPVFLGLDVGPSGALVDCKGEISPNLYAIGPPCKGALWETTDVPEIREQAHQLAGRLTIQLERNSRIPSALETAV